MQIFIGEAHLNMFVDAKRMVENRKTKRMYETKLTREKNSNRLRRPWKNEVEEALIELGKTLVEELQIIRDRNVWMRFCRQTQRFMLKTICFN